MNKIKVIFDTDPGVDDAMVVLFLYYAPEIELIGITTTHGNGTIATTTRNALYLTERFGIDLPVAQGSGAPLAGAAADPPVFVHGHNGLGDIPLPQNIAKKRPIPGLLIALSSTWSGLMRKRWPLSPSVP